MDDRRFDNLVRRLGDRPASRRRVARGAVAGGAAALAGFLGLDRGRFGPAPAFASAADRTCQAAANADPRSIVSKNACGETGPTRCGANNRGLCVQTVGHIPRCVTGFSPSAGRRRCPRVDQCDARRDCPNGAVCGKVEGCCGKPHNLCLPRHR